MFQIGPRWEHVVEKCSRGRYQPLLLLYTNPNANPVCTDTAPKKRVMAPGYGTPAKGMCSNFSIQMAFSRLVLRINGALAIFQPYRDMEAGDNQFLKS